MSTSISTQLIQLRARVDELARGCGRNPEDIQIVAVSKTHPVDRIRAAAAAGQQIFGENRVQELIVKCPLLPHLEWHMIGHLQTNKVKQVLPLVRLIHSLDSVKLLHAIDKHAAALHLRACCLVQVNISEEDSKTGLPPEACNALFEAAQNCEHVQIHGLMGIASLTEDRERIRREFQSLRGLRDELAQYACPHIELRHLSMGMSTDYDLAIEEGATLIRLGTTIFGERH